MNDPTPLPHLILPTAQIPAGEDAVNIAVGAKQPLAAEVMKPLLDLGMDHAYISLRGGYAVTLTSRSKKHRFRLLLEGELSVQVGGKKYDLGPGDLICLPVGTVYHISSPETTRFLHMSFQDLPLWEPLTKRGVHVRPYESADLIYLLLRRIADAYQDRSIRALRFARGDARSLADLIKREVYLAGGSPPKCLAALQAMVADIQQEPEAGWDLPTMAERLHTSTFTINRLFMKEYGLTPMGLVVRERMLRAREILATTSNKVEAVAAQMGYKSLSSFSRLFKKHIGRTPAQCREDEA
jgi:AraC-like DNA-binding protein/mannose-6-phosphate isomerase-like protein (cupin superfamily)